MLACVAASRYILVFMAGAIITGAVVAITVVVSMSSAMPDAILPMKFAVAGATRNRSASLASDICSTSKCLSLSNISFTTRLPLMVSSVSGVIISAPAHLDFLIDGMVVKVRDFATREALGATEKFPRWAMAFKFAAEETTTTVRDITWEVGRTGKLTPRASFDPVELAGATIRHATLNNFDDIQRKRVGIGSRVFIRRSNDVIPEILSAVEGDVPEGKVEKPKVCPA